MQVPQTPSYVGVVTVLSPTKAMLSGPTGTCQPQDATILIEGSDNFQRTYELILKFIAVGQYKWTAGKCP